MNTQIYIVYSRALDYSKDDSLPVPSRVAFRKVSNLIFGEQYLPALNHLCQLRALEKLWKGNEKPFEEVSDELAMMLISEAPTLARLDQIRESMGPWAKTGVASVLFVARTAGLKAIVQEKLK
jgi:hypothetical protein